MNERGWVVLVVRGLGLYLFVLWLPSTLGTIISIAYSLQSEPGPTTGWTTSVAHPMTQEWFTLATEMAALGIGLYLLLGGRWLMDRICQQVVGVCPMCGEKTGGGACPECGHGMAGRTGG